MSDFVSKGALYNCACASRDEQSSFEAFEIAPGLDCSSAAKDMGTYREPCGQAEKKGAALHLLLFTSYSI